MSSGYVRVQVATAITMVWTCSAFADFVTFTNYGDWQSAAGPFHTIDFTDHPHGTLITDQYQGLGVTFTGPFDDDVIIESATFSLDGFGLQAQLSDGDVIMEFSEPQFEFGVHYPGNILIEVFNEGEQVYIDDFFAAGFAGVVSDQPFDSVRLADPISGAISVDNVYFTIPAPGALALLGLGVSVLVSRRRRSA